MFCSKSCSSSHRQVKRLWLCYYHAFLFEFWKVFGFRDLYDCMTEVVGIFLCFRMQNGFDRRWMELVLFHLWWTLFINHKRFIATSGFYWSFHSTIFWWGFCFIEKIPSEFTRFEIISLKKKGNTLWSVNMHFAFVLFLFFIFISWYYYCWNFCVAILFENGHFRQNTFQFIFHS